MSINVRTSLEEELAEFRRWKQLPLAEGRNIFERLVRHEFQSPEEHRARECFNLSRLVRHAVAHVPHYGELFRQLGMTAEDVRTPADLAPLPVLKKHEVIQRSEAFRAKWLPRGEGPPIVYDSTGTTGQPVRVLMSRTASAMFAFLWHRMARWFRYDPMGTFMKIRIPSTLPRTKDGSRLAPGKMLRRRVWMYLGKYFETGPELIYSVSTEMQLQLKWLKQFRPDYLMAYPGVFEEIALACEGKCPTDSLKSILGIGSGVSPGVRAWTESVYGVPMDQNYGLNEIGIVAVRCRAGRYHVNNEHCLVEIVDSEGRACPPGTSGHVLVTTLRNIASPLLRYDTGDIAMVADGPCPCGRTLPSFGEIIGRYRRFAGLPAGTRERVRALLKAFEMMPLEFTRNLRRYQIYQNHEDHFEVRLTTVGPMPPEFEARVREQWEKDCANSRPLTLVEGATITTSPGGKLMDFDSAFYSRDDMASRARVEEKMQSGPPS